MPDIRGQPSVTAAALAQARQAGRYLLTFNEPDSSAQANMTVAQALADWPQLAYLQAIYQRYHLPIWLTEFGMVRFGSPTTYPADAQQSAFLTGAASMMAGLPYVQRYAWFALPVSTGPTGDGNLGLFSSGAVATPEGRAFEAAAGR